MFSLNIVFQQFFLLFIIDVWSVGCAVRSVGCELLTSNRLVSACPLSNHPHQYLSSAGVGMWQPVCLAALLQCIWPLFGFSFCAFFCPSFFSFQPLKYCFSFFSLVPCLVLSFFCLFGLCVEKMYFLSCSLVEASFVSWCIVALRGSTVMITARTVKFDETTSRTCTWNYAFTIFPVSGTFRFSL